MRDLGIANQSELARLLAPKKVSQQSINQLFAGAKGKPVQNPRYLVPLADVLKCSPKWLVGEEDDEPPPTIAKPPVIATTLEFGGLRYAALAKYDLRASAGRGMEIPAQPAVINQVLFRMDWLRRVSRAPLEQLAVVEVEGDSMEPTLRSGDNVLVDLLENRPGQRDAVYVINTEGSLQVKRLQFMQKTKLLTIKSDNPQYDTERDVDPKSIDVVGRVIWVGRQM